jgi:hypothetical protein
LEGAPLVDSKQLVNRLARPCRPASTGAVVSSAIHVVNADGTGMVNLTSNAASIVGRDGYLLSQYAILIRNVLSGWSEKSF